MDQSTFCGYRFCGLHYVKSISLAFSVNSILHGISDACVYFRSFRVYMGIPTFRSQATKCPLKSNVFTFFTLKSLCDQNYPCRKMGQGQPESMIYINYNRPESPILHTKFH